MFNIFWFEIVVQLNDRVLQSESKRFEPLTCHNRINLHAVASDVLDQQIFQHCSTADHYDLCNSQTLHPLGL